MKELETILEEIKSGKILGEEMFFESDLDSVLDIRDEPEFEERWMKVYENIKGEFKAENFTPEQLSLVESLRKESFLAVSKSSGQHEISSYISDDFELIGKAALLNRRFEFLDQMLEKYRNGGLI
ncbi:hypothetical protein EUZ85_07990 [Hahella sp. KA22]|uniref:hypothetical protein n=1 Tax=Hahella sp. KA22 TaxID=1628392 RepID=UPI000FDE4B12|nr:hypothetical protein [Hahella sp. KA22]AZZ90661.1 hypothetical protein ENC22_05440 [Hahella sp. KA22]QAY54031.1 hypothetical protein EUZ85_07990 [Hahella sp. KA22]